jgi:hypothetical protein
MTAIMGVWWSGADRTPTKNYGVFFVARIGNRYKKNEEFF